MIRLLAAAALLAPAPAMAQDWYRYADGPVTTDYLDVDTIRTDGAWVPIPGWPRIDGRAQLPASSACRTFAASCATVNGLAMKFTSWSSTPLWTMALRV